MITQVDSRLYADLVEYNFKFCCEDCAHYELATLECSLGFCTAPHRSVPLDLGSTVIFCKAFELT